MRTLAGLLCVVALAGCGLGEGEERSGGAELRVTRDFGRELVASAKVAAVREDQTVMRLLASERDVETRFGGKFVQSIDGIEGSTSGGRRDWFFWVNGVEASVGADDYELSPGDVVHWDYRRWEAAMRVPAIVGAYPEPFLSGVQGKRLPVRLECEERGEACEEVRKRLTDAGVATNVAPVGVAAGPDVLRVVVARWERARQLQSVAAVEDGPSRSGVFARFDGDRLLLLDDSGRVAREAPPGSGLVAATAFAEVEAIWLVTGADDEGVLRAARALDADSLRDAFAVVVTPDGAEKVPVP